MTTTDRIIQLVQETATRLRAFEPRGPGEGNRVTNAVMASINQLVTAQFGEGLVEPTLGNRVRQSVDFYVKDEATIIEVEFSLSNPYPCLEKDAFKALLAKDAGHPVKKLVLIGDPGCGNRLAAPAPQAVISWLTRHHELEVTVVELTG